MMVLSLDENCWKHREGITDPRLTRNRRHKLGDILVIALCGFLAGCEGWVDVELFGKAKRGWLEKFLELPNGIPSHDTFGRVFSLLSATAFEACFFDWVSAVNQVMGGQVIAIDGKELRHSFDTVLGQKAIHLVSA